METLGPGPIGETIDTSRHRALGTASRVSILKLVRDSEGGMDASEVAGGTGLHLSTARAHLDRLVEAGLLVKARASGGKPGRPAWRYRATADDPAPAPYRSLAAALLDHLGEGGGDVRAEAARVGQNWGRHLAAAAGTADGPAGTVLNVLQGLGFSPRLVDPDPTGAGAASDVPDADTTEMHLHTCPFLDLVGRNPDAMCGLHVGVIRGALEQAGAHSNAAVLEPFGAPTACVVRLLRHEPHPGRGEPRPGRGQA